MFHYVRRPLCLLALLLAGTILVTLQFFPVEGRDYSAYDKDSVTITGYVLSKEIKRSSGLTPYSLLITLDCGKDTDTQYVPEERVLVRVPVETDQSVEDQTVAIGSWVRTRGTLRCFSAATNHGEFDQALYYRIMRYDYEIRNAKVLAVSETVDPFSDQLYRLKRYLSDVLDDITTSEEDAAILRAMLLGEKGLLDQDTKDLYQGAGIIHVLAISGLHIAIIGMGLYRLLCTTRLPKPVRLYEEKLLDRYVFRIGSKRSKERFRKFWQYYNRHERRVRAKQVIAATFSIVIMYLYGRMTGMGASSYRAIVMFVLHLTALSLHRVYDLLTALSIAAILLLIEQPLYLYHSGFLFSFAAIMGIGILGPVMPQREESELTFGDGIAGWIETLGVRTLEKPMQGLTVEAATYPVYLWVYYAFPIYSMLLNLVVLPLMGVLIVVGIVSMMLGCIGDFLKLCGERILPGTDLQFIHEFVGQIVDLLKSLAGLLPHFILYFYRALCELSQSLPGHGGIIGRPEMWQIVLYVLSMGIVVLCTYEAPRLLKILPIVAAMLMLTWRFDYGLEIHMIDVGQGDGIYISYAGTNILIDGGSTSKSDVGTYQIEPLLKYYGADHIDLLVMTHEDQDHMNGMLTLIEDADRLGIRIDTLLVPDVIKEQRGENYLKLVRVSEAAGVQVKSIHRGDEIKLKAKGLDMIRNQQVRFTCLHPGSKSDYEEPNATSVVLYLEYGSFSGLLTGDLEEQGEKNCLEYMKSRADKFPNSADRDTSTFDEITFLKVAHHGSSGATSEQFLEEIHPRIAGISCGINNRYGHPHPECVERLRDVGAMIVNTCVDGEVTLWTNGNKCMLK